MAVGDCTLCKTCTTCGLTKPVADYSGARRGKFGKAAVCKPCARKRSLEYMSSPETQALYAELNRASYIRRRDSRRAARGWVAPKNRTRQDCTKCGVVKPLSGFYNDKKTPNGRKTKCRECSIKHASAWYAANPEKAAVSIAKWKNENRDKVRQIQSRRWYRKKSEPEFRLRYVMRTAINRSLKRGRQSGAYKRLGYTIDELRSHLERQFSRGMSWDNYGKWHIDHVVPLASFDIESEDAPDFSRAWSLPNLRPLWGHENVRKGAKRLFLI